MAEREEEEEQESQTEGIVCLHFVLGTRPHRINMLPQQLASHALFSGKGVARFRYVVNNRSRGQYVRCIVYVTTINIYYILRS